MGRLQTAPSGAAESYVPRPSRSPALARPETRLLSLRLSRSPEIRGQMLNRRRSPAYAAAVFAAAALCLLRPAAAAISGTVRDASATDHPLSILIRGRSVHTAVAVAQPSGIFTLPAALPAGGYVLEVCGSSRRDYAHVRVGVGASGALETVEARRDPLLLPGGAAMNVTGVLEFVLVGEAVYGESRVESWALLPLLNRPFVLLQLFAGAFVLWFPRYIASIDPDMLYELTGETPPDIGDPNKVLKRLLEKGDGGRRAADAGAGAGDFVNARE